MNYKQIKAIAGRVEKTQGWDFSSMRAEREPVPWDYPAVVRGYLQPGAKVLDLGTGGGEQFIELADAFNQGEGIGIDAEQAMIETAEHNLPPSLKDKVKFKVMKQEQLEFVGNSFDLVINRQAPFTPDEIVRVLKPAGYFITQQVAEKNCLIFLTSLAGISPGYPNLKISAALYPSFSF